MPTSISYEFELDDEGLNWLRMRITTERGTVTIFTVQYETTVDGERVAVIRYDSAHGFPHRDVLSRSGRVTKEPLAGDPSLDEALTIGERDIRQNWRAYRDRFLGDTS